MIFLAQGVNTTAHNSALAAVADIVALGVVVGLAVGLAFLLKEGATIEGATAVAAGEALLVPLLVEGVDNPARRSLPTARALRGERALVAVLAVGHAVLLKEAAPREGAAAAVAHKAVHVPLFVHRRHAAVGDGLATEAAHGAIDVAVALFAVGQPVDLVEARRAQGVLTRRTHKVVGVELFAQRLDAFAQDGFLAPATVAPAGADPVVDAAHLVAQGAQQIVDVATAAAPACSVHAGGGGRVLTGGAGRVACT